MKNMKIAVICLSIASFAGIDARWNFSISTEEGIKRCNARDLNDTKYKNPCWLEDQQTNALIEIHDKLEKISSVEQQESSIEQKKEELNNISYCLKSKAGIDTGSLKYIKNWISKNEKSDKQEIVKAVTQTKKLDKSYEKDFNWYFIQKTRHLRNIKDAEAEFERNKKQPCDRHSNTRYKQELLERTNAIELLRHASQLTTLEEIEDLIATEDVNALIPTPWQVVNCLLMLSWHFKYFPSR